MQPSDFHFPLVAAPLGSSRWLLNLRWFAAGGQSLTIAAVWRYIDVPIRFDVLALLVFVTVLTNVLYAFYLRRLDPGGPDDQTLERGRAAEVALSLMILDLVTLTAMLRLAGGADNPFVLFYFVNLAVASAAIPPRFAWSLTLTAIGGYVYLLAAAEPLELFGDGPDRPLKVAGRVIAFTACTSVVTYYVSRVAGELRDRHRRLMDFRQIEDDQRRLRSLTTLAAGAAHELSTPLSTIDVVTKELTRHLSACDKPESVTHDLRLIDDELERCRGILGRMRAAAGDRAAEPFEPLTAGDLIDVSLDGVRDPHRVDVIDSAEAESARLWVPPETVAQSIRNLIHNALDASPPGERVCLAVRRDASQVCFDVTDQGTGMDADELAKIGEPFYTTKVEGRGTGLGLFLTKNVVAQLGGTLTFTSAPGRGTTATLRLPETDADNPTPRTAPV